MWGTAPPPLPISFSTFSLCLLLSLSKLPFLLNELAGLLAWSSVEGKKTLLAFYECPWNASLMHFDVDWKDLIDYNTSHRWTYILKNWNINAHTEYQHVMRTWSSKTHKWNISTQMLCKCCQIDLDANVQHSLRGAEFLDSDDKILNYSLKDASFGTEPTCISVCSAATPPCSENSYRGKTH